MCRWGCITIDTTYACKWCGTRFCADCLKGDFHGEMKAGDSLKCKKCKQLNCQGKRVEYVPGAKPPEAGKKQTKGKGKSKSAKTGKKGKKKK